PLVSRAMSCTRVPASSPTSTTAAITSSRTTLMVRERMPAPAGLWAALPARGDDSVAASPRRGGHLIGPLRGGFVVVAFRPPGAIAEDGAVVLHKVGVDAATRPVQDEHLVALREPDE